MPDAFEVRLSRDAARVFQGLADPVRRRVRTALLQLAADAVSSSRISGKRVKTIKGAADTFHRLRVGDLRVLYDVIPEDRVVLVLGIVDRKDLERWLRNR